ncbi:MAG: Adenine phosphoribosyltransferase [candidate division BRC1 bacterium ADurb.BinA364]|nr:MAG: Adenine phosphoribosyltransferase [candidate division BRC1 bacterium ADurb.BinA364]
MDLAAYIRDIPDFPKPGILFKDITPLLAAPEAFAETIRLFAERYRGRGIDRIMGVESRGFIFGAALALELGLPFIPARKPGKLPYKTISESYSLEYGEATLEIHEDALEQGDKVLLMDDLLATGGTLAACRKLIERLGGEVAEIATVVELAFLNGRERLGGAPYFSLVRF